MKAVSLFTIAAIATWASSLNLAQNTSVAPPVAPAAPGVPVMVKQDLQKKDKNRKAADEFFLGPIVKLEFDFEPEEWEYLKRDNRRYAEATMTEITQDGKKTVYKNVAVKLKGAAGSFRGPDDRPGLTVNMDKYKGASRFRGMEKFHLNNGAQDGSFLNEFMGYDWCRAANVPASRMTHVIVKWQGRELGLYGFKESFTEDFISYFFEKNEGSLYDGHFVTEIDGNLEKQQGKPRDDRSDLKALVDACKEGDPVKRLHRVYEKLDVDAFLRFLAMETLTSHWDGYNFNRNNYRIYFDPKTGKANFFCHGMDQIFGDANWPIMRDPGSLVGQIVWSHPEWRAHYRKVVEDIYNRVLKPRDWEARVAEQGKKVQAGLAKFVSEQAAKDYQGHINGARDRMMARLTAIGKQLGDMPKPLEWQNGVVKLGPKSWRGEGGGALAEAQMDGQHALHIRADGTAAASWRRTIPLETGRYRFLAQVKVSNVEGGGDQSGEGAGLRISGGTRAGQNGLKGSSQWQQLVYEFDAPGGDVVLVAELRSQKGEAWFASNSFQLVKLK